MRLGFIGLGLMGRPIATNLLRKSGLPLIVHNRSQDAVQEMLSLGAEAASTARDLASRADVIMTCLPDGPTDVEVLTGTDGVLAGAQSGSVVVDHTTLDAATAQMLADRCAEKGIAYLDAPVSGSGPVAWRGEITVMVGGDRETFERVAPVLRAAASTVQLMGAVGAGSMTKLVNNMLKDINALAAMEALVLGAKAGIDPAALYDVVRRASGASRQWERVVPKIIARDFTRTSSIRVNVKDQEMVQQLVGSTGVQLPLHQAAHALLLRALDAGLGDRDSTEAVRLYEVEAGIEVRAGD